MASDSGQFDELSELWKEQENEDMDMTLASVQQQANRFERGIWRRNTIEVIAALLVVFFFARMAMRGGHVLVVAGALITVAAALYIIWRLNRDGSAEAPSPTLATTEYVEAHRAALLKQARLLRRAPVWYVGPIAAGLVTMSAGRILEQLSLGASVVRAVIVLGVSVAFCAGVAVVNLRGARKLQSRAAEIAMPEGE